MKPLFFVAYLIFCFLAGMQFGFGHMAVGGLLAILAGATWYMGVKE